MPKLSFYNILVALGIFVVLSIGHIEASKYCKERSQRLYIAGIVAEFMCPTQECADALRKRLYEQKQAHWCKYVP